MSSILREHRRRCMTTPGGLCTMPALWTSSREATTALPAHRWSPRRAAWTAGAARAWAASRPECCRRSCASWRRPCCACCAAGRRSTRPSAPVGTPCAVRAVPPSSRWGVSAGSFPGSLTYPSLHREFLLPARCWLTNAQTKDVPLHLAGSLYLVTWKVEPFWNILDWGSVFHNVISLNPRLFFKCWKQGLDSPGKASS